MEKGTLQDFDALYAIMEEAFPEVERRSYEGKKKEGYKLLSAYGNMRILYLLNIWQ